jgi:transcriptional regulator with XRE-family HTH domain
MPPRSRYALDPAARRRLAAASDMTDTSIRKYLRGGAVNASTVDRLARAAKALGIELPAPSAPGEGASR